MKAKVYLSDEGFGHIVRQRAILHEIAERDASVSFTIQTQRHLDAAQRIINGVQFTEKYNNISWAKLPNGSPDLVTIRDTYTDYIERSDEWINSASSSFEADFVLSDFVYEAFSLAHRFQTPCFGVAHFTWDWFFSKLYPPPVSTKVLDHFFRMAKLADVLYFPPFTPEEILNYYSANAKSVPLILRKGIKHLEAPKNGRFRVLIIDSGSGLLKDRIEQALNAVAEMDDFQFFVSSNFMREQENVSFIDANELMADYIGDMDLVIGRAGFNTISECIGLRTPMLLIGEAMNPEINENILNLKKCGLGTFISIESFSEELPKVLTQFVRHEYNSIQENIRDHALPTNGAEVIAEDILDRLS